MVDDERGSVTGWSEGRHALPIATSTARSRATSQAVNSAVCIASPMVTVRVAAIT